MHAWILIYGHRLFFCFHKITARWGSFCIEAENDLILYICIEVYVMRGVSLLRPAHDSIFSKKEGKYYASKSNTVENDKLSSMRIHTVI